MKSPSETKSFTIRSLIEALTKIAKDHNRDQMDTAMLGDGFDQGVYIDKWGRKEYKGLTNRFELEIWDCGIVLTPKE